LWSYEYYRSPFSVSVAVQGKRPRESIRQKLNCDDLDADNMRRKLVAGNWKMNGSKAASAALLDAIVAGIDQLGEVEVALCPPSILLALAEQKLQATRIHWGAQNLDTHSAGAFTGEISGPMLADFGCHYVLVGHSERRALYGESSILVADKFLAAQEHGLVPVLCVGETLEQRKSGATEEVIAEQLQAVMQKVSNTAWQQAVVAYEPVWAIGTGMTATPEQAQMVHAHIRTLLTEQIGAMAENIQLLYGGSVKADNAASLFAEQDIDGGLIGGAALQAESFLAICRAAV